MLSVLSSAQGRAGGLVAVGVVAVGVVAGGWHEGGVLLA